MIEPQPVVTSSPLLPMPFPRSSGILLHPTSFPSRFGIGDLGSEAYRFIDFLARSGQLLWQILPLGPTGYGDSPYQCFSAMAGNPLLISPELLVKAGWLTDADLQDIPEFPLHIDFGNVIPAKMDLLKRAGDRFQAQATPAQRQALEAFCATHRYWLEDYALFMAIKQANGGASWQTWDAELAQRKPHRLDECRQTLANEIFFHQFLQFVFYEQWQQVKAYAGDRGIQIMGDLPIYVAHDSAEVWAHPEYFCLEADTGLPALMAGVPPDYFSPTGQLWGNPIYDWERLEQEEFSWWVERFRLLFECVDLIRIDHFRGFESYWAVPQGEDTAINGTWETAPGAKLFETIQQKLGKLPIVAEDLGFITPEVEALRDQFAFPGMRILQFAFDSDCDNPYLTFNYCHNSVVYTGTHDNDTTVGWYNKRSPDEQARVNQYFSHLGKHGIHWDFIRLAFGSIANQAIVPLQDLIGLDTEARMNAPSFEMGNWAWRYAPDALTDEMGDRLLAMTRRYGRLINPAKA
jgi:4-alpha-glucanotransferase